MGGTGMFFLLQSIFFALLLAISYFKSERLNSYETKIYSKMIIISLAELVLELILDFLVPIYDKVEFLVVLLGKVYCVCILLWITLLSYYVVINTLIMKNKKELIQRINKIYILITIILAFLILILDINFFYDGNIYYSYGMGVSIDYVATFIHSLVAVFCIVVNIKRVKNNKFLPVYIFLFIGSICGFVQMQHPQYLLSTFVHVFITFVMYFTIENPDMKMLNEVYKNKELMEQGYEDKYNFLFEMTQEARGPLVNISSLSNTLRMEDDPQKVKDGLLTLNNMVRQLDFSVNNILNISSLDISKVKIVDNKYDLEKMCRDLEVRVKQEIKPDVTFNLTMPKQMPILFGDYMKIRQILYSLLINACKNTENGTINMKVNLIEKYDVARVIFNISDTGVGMPIEQINEILSSTGSLDQNELENLEKKEFNVTTCQKVVKIMGGSLMIKSNIGEGTEVILTVDQRVYHEKENSILSQYENAITNYRKVLIVSQNKDKLAIIKKKFADNNITYSNLYYGADAIDRLKSGKKFDFILVEDEMKEMTGFMTLKGMQKLNNFKTPVIIMLNEDKDHIKDHYLDDGFSDYLLLDNLESELDRIIEKY